MTTAVDTNVVIALWDKDAALSSAAQNALEAAFNRGNLVAAAPVFAELIAAPGRTETFVGSFFEDTGIVIDWELREHASYSCRLLDWSSCSVEWLPPSDPGRPFVSSCFSDTRDTDLLESKCNGFE